MNTHNENSVQTSTAPHSASVVQVETNRLVPHLLVCSIICGIALGVAILALILGQISERESRMLQYYVLEVDGKLMKSGIIDKGYEAWKREHQK